MYTAIFSVFLLVVMGQQDLSSNLSSVDAFSTPSSYFQPIERMTVDQYRQARNQNKGQHKLLLDRPILIEKVLSVEECEDICSEMIKLAGHMEIQVQQKRSTQKENKHEEMVLFHDCTLLDAFDLMMDSLPGNSFFAFVEGLLETQQTSTDQHNSRMMFQRVQQPLINAREKVFQTHTDDETDTNHGSPSTASVNWFDYFPPGAKPTDCVILAGQGATSTFHRDPFEWLGTSMCLEGRKIWRFIQPLPTVHDSEEQHDDDDDDDDTIMEMDHVQRADDFLQAYPLESIAWDTDDDSISNNPMVLSAGWQSDMSLYHTVDKDNNIPSARELALMDVHESNSLLDDLAMDASSLTPNISMERKDIEGAVGGFYSTVQRQGDLLLIPAHWYHQTYAPEPSLAVASQRCGSSLDAKRVFRHILLQQKGLRPEKIPSTLTQSESDFADHTDPEALVNELFAFLVSHQKGENVHTKG